MSNSSKSASKSYQHPIVVILSEAEPSSFTEASHSSASQTPIATPPSTPGISSPCPKVEAEMESTRNDQPPADYSNVGSTPTPAGTSASETPIEPTPSSSTTNAVTSKVPSTEKDAGTAKSLKKSKAKGKQKAVKIKCKKKSGDKISKKKKKKTVYKEDDDDDSSDEEEDLSDSSSNSGSDSSDSDSSSESEAEERKKKKKKSKRAQVSSRKKKSKKSKKSRRYISSSSDSDSDSDSESESDSGKRSRRRRKRHVKSSRSSSEQEDATSGAVSDVLPPPPPPVETLKADDTLLLQQIRNLLITPGVPAPVITIPDPATDDSASGDKKTRKSGKKDKKDKKDGKPEFKRVDQLWDSNIHDYKLQETAEEQSDEFDNYIFHVRRRFDWENKYRSTVVDIKSKHLRDALKDVMKDVKAVSLVENEPCIDPNVLFLYLEEMRTYYKKSLKKQIKKERKRKAKKKLESMRAHLKIMIRYLDKDYDEVKKTLFPMLKAGNITFDLLWALYKPNTIAYSSTYGAHDHPRCFLVDMAYHEKHFMRGEFYIVDGRYLDYDGKNFGLGSFEMAVEHFKGPKKITSLPTYPLMYHKDPEGIKTQLIERGKKFVSLAGMNYKFMKGMAFQKRKKSILKFNINGRVMIDPKTFRRINANYQVSSVRNNASEEDDEDDDDSCGCDCGSSDEDVDGDSGGAGKPKFKVIFDDNHKPHVVEVNSDDEDNEEVAAENLDKLPNGVGDANAEDESSKKREFTEQELLIASPIVLGFSFTEKDWFEFSLSGISDIVWNESAFDSLVLPPTHKQIVKAQVCSHKFHAAETIDDVIQGKGKGLVFVLHGPPGVGKTLTAEGIAEFLRCPLYAVSAGDLGTDARIEHELNKIMDIAHSWGAVLLLDEADVFLEKRQHQDVHRNALVSIFLRLLEYFQGILFLTTNRVETFDEAFQSRIHIALKYNELTVKAKREIWKLFLQKVKDTGSEVSTFKESQYDQLAKNQLNGRQIKNAVKTAQALAVFEKTPLSMDHIKQVLDVGESFNRDLKGGSGFEDAMKSYI